MDRFLGRFWWVGLMSCVLAPCLPGQSSLNLGAAGTGFLPAPPKGQSSSYQANPQPAQDPKPDPPLQPANPRTVQPAAKPSNPELAPPPKRMFGMIPDFENTNDTPANRHPLTVREKYALSLHQAFDISSHLGNAFQA